jgi:hypothetical protein
MNAEPIRSAELRTSYGFDLSPRARVALVEVMSREGGTPAEVVERAALALRDTTTGCAPKVSVDIRLGVGT